MKKSLFGYNIKETDNLFNSMQNHIDVLTGKITNLNAELSSKGTNFVDTNETDRKIIQLQNKISELEKENSLIKQELSNKPKPEIQDNNKKVEHIGKIYLTAYEEAEKIKKQALVDADEYLSKFEGIRKETKQKFATALTDIRAQQNNMEELLNDSVQSIVEMLRDFGIQSDLMLKKLDNLETGLNVEKVAQTIRG
ncbi:MAG: hypothetical protein A2Y15_00215 [Clostridiales bacterium GWF2_36_10]|nr:MAG: hypothetical protein A2Y15_00215 [Clostridiales bacterium GWF2_36_10]HAN21786.1 hypothetical protein [Clostridiales bacterium]